MKKELQDIKSILMDLKEKVQNMCISENISMEELYDSYDLSAEVSNIADELSFELSNSDEKLGSRLWNRYKFLKDLDEEYLKLEESYKKSEYEFNVLRDSLK